MSYSYENQQLQNQRSLDNPEVGDYWTEMFCPYFLIVDILHDDAFVILNCLGGPDSHTRKHEINARVDAGEGYWRFDYSKTMAVDRAWIKAAVKYSIIDGFVADVSNTEKTRCIVDEWRSHKAKELHQQIKKMQEEYETFTGWKYLKET